MQPWRPATLTQPFQCDLQPQTQETHRTTHVDTTTRCRTQRRNQSRPERPQPHPQHTRGTFHRRLQPLYTEKYKFSFSGFLPKTKPRQHSCSHYTIYVSQHPVANLHLSTRTATPDDNNHAAITMRSGTIHSRKRAELRTQTQPLVAEHRGGTNRVRNDRSRTRGTHEVPSTAGRLQPLYTAKYKVSCSGFLPKTKPRQHSCSHYNIRFAASRSKPASLYTHGDTR